MKKWLGLAIFAVFLTVAVGAAAARDRGYRGHYEPRRPRVIIVERHHGHGNEMLGNVVGGLIGGLVAGVIVNNSRQDQAPQLPPPPPQQPVYMPSPPPPQPVYIPEPLPSPAPIRPVCANCVFVTGGSEDAIRAVKFGLKSRNYTVVNIRESASLEAVISERHIGDPTVKVNVELSRISSGEIVGIGDGQERYPGTKDPNHEIKKIDAVVKASRAATDKL